MRDHLDWSVLRSHVRPLIDVFVGAMEVATPGSAATRKPAKKAAPSGWHFEYRATSLLRDLMQTE